jgi:hypothetical protein
MVFESLNKSSDVYFAQNFVLKCSIQNFAVSPSTFKFEKNENLSDFRLSVVFVSPLIPFSLSLHDKFYFYSNTFQALVFSIFFICSWK